jgi:L-aminoadipate-semialdehyde dehydrogenase
MARSDSIHDIIQQTGVNRLLDRLGIQPLNSGACWGEWIDQPSGRELISYTPIDGSELARVRMAAEEDYDEVLWQATQAFQKWQVLPAPKRGEIVRQIGDELRRHKDDLGALVTLESGKILAEGKGEVQEMIDIGDFAVGLSRQLYGLTMPSERPGHRMYEQWHPLGVAGVITAFNFPVAVWSWNALLAMVCGDCVVWKPSEKTPLTAIAVQHIVNRVLDRNGWKGVLNLVIGDVRSVGRRMLSDPRVPLISATGSCRMGHYVAEAMAERLGRTLLELGGNNGVIVMNDANLDLALRAAVFGAIGTAGQRCTTIRRLFLQKGIAAEMTSRLLSAYKQVRIGNPMDEATTMGPLIDRDAVSHMMKSLSTIRQQGGEVLYGGREVNIDHSHGILRGGCYVEPTLVTSPAEMPMLCEEVFGPILHLVEFDTLDDAIRMHNNVPQGLSSAIFTNDLLSAEKFLSVQGSDCGIANVNIGTSGAEIGGAFGGEKETGGGRESGSDAWKAYMRRQTVTINYSSDLPLAQGIKFDV